MKLLDRTTSELNHILKAVDMRHDAIIITPVVLSDLLANAIFR